MQKTERRLRLAKETIRSLVPDELRQVGGGGRMSCGGGTACDCSGPIGSGSSSSSAWESLNCTPANSIMQY
jgi:hypothetical protein